MKKVQAEFADVSSVPDSTLVEFVRNSHLKIPSNMIFSVQQEKDLVDYILKCVNHYYGLSINELKELAYQLAIELELDIPDSWVHDKKAGRQWYRLFMKRHPELALRTPEQTSMNRVKAFCKPNVDKFFENYGRMVDLHLFDAQSIYNMDESDFSTVPSKIGKVIALKGARRVGKLEAGERGTMVTMALTVSASGNSIPPFFIFPLKNYQRQLGENASPGSKVICNGSGWMCQKDFTTFITHFIDNVKPSIEKPVLLLLDNHQSHLSVEALDLAANNGVHILSFPPHCSHRLQPLDVSVFGPVKTYYKSQCAAWQKGHANEVKN